MSDAVNVNGARLFEWSELQEASDNDLLHQVILGNDDAFVIIVDRYQRLIYSVAYKLVKGEGEAEDVVQIVFLDVFRKKGLFDPSKGTLKSHQGRVAGRWVRQQHLWPCEITRDPCCCRDSECPSLRASRDLSSQTRTAPSRFGAGTERTA